MIKLDSRQNKPQTREKRASLKKNNYKIMSKWKILYRQCNKNLNRTNRVKGLHTF